MPVAQSSVCQFSDKLSIAPMMKVTDRHFRVLMRLLSSKVKLYTEMQVSNAVMYGARGARLDFSRCEHPLAIQFAGCEPAQLASCARIAEEFGYDEINFNVGCPSSRVRDARFGACLMADPPLVARCVNAMWLATSLPVTVKTRIGIDHNDSYAALAEFVRQVAEGGCEHFIVHARKAWLNGLNPKQNRQLPKLRYERVYQLKQDFPHLRFTLNGGIKTLEDARQHLSHVDGVMIGRHAQDQPWQFAQADALIFAQPSKVRSRRQVVEAYLTYCETQLQRGVALRALIRPLLGLYHGQPRARAWRHHLATHCAASNAGVEVIAQGLELVEPSLPQTAAA